MEWFHSVTVKWLSITRGFWSFVPHTATYPENFKVVKPSLMQCIWRKNDTKENCTVLISLDLIVFLEASADDESLKLAFGGYQHWTRTPGSKGTPVHFLSFWIRALMVSYGLWVGMEEGCMDQRRPGEDALWAQLRFNSLFPWCHWAPWVQWSYHKFLWGRRLTISVIRGLQEVPWLQGAHQQ